jgi:DNA-binding transcriptional MocR family regulator
MGSASDPPAAQLARRAETTLAEQLSARFAEHIRQRLLAPGARLPSVRECARRHGVSPHTVVAAYDQLLALGLVDARRQRGFFVRASDARPGETDGRRSPSAAAPTARGAVRHPLPVSATSLIRGMFQPPGAKPMPGLGTLPADWLDLPLLASALRKATAGAQLGALSLQYGDPAGERRLREALALKLADLGVAASAQQVVTTVGATHALDIVTRSLLRAGDSVLVDEPGWSVEYSRLAALGLRVVPVPRGEDGPDLALLERLLVAHRPRLYVTVSVLHNPTGAALSQGH